MRRFAVILWAAMTTIAAMLALGGITRAAELKVLTSVALTAALDELRPIYEKASGDKLNIGYGLIADWRKRILDGETADVIILSRPVMEELAKQDKFAAGGLVTPVLTLVTARPPRRGARKGSPPPAGSRAGRARRPSS